MRAAVLESVNTPLEVITLQRPEPRYGEVRLRVVGCGVCHTDLHVMKDEVAFPVPCVLGHEVSGIVDAVADGVDGLAVGDRVASSFVMPCGTCRHCARGLDDLCERFFGMNRLNGTLYDGETRLFRPSGEPVAMDPMGGLAEYVSVPATDVFHVPDSSPLADAAILGCGVFAAVGAVRNVAQVTPGDSVAVIATGGVGLNIVQVAKAFGATTIVAVDVAADKLDLARRLGATHVVDGRDPDHVAQIRAATGGRGVDVAFEALGSPQTVDTAVRVVDEGGAVVLVGIAPKGQTAEFEITHVVRRKIRILGSFGARTRADMPLVLELAATGAITLDGVITERIGLDDAADAYERLAQGKILGRAVVEMAPDPR